MSVIVMWVLVYILGTVIALTSLQPHYHEHITVNYLTTHNHNLHDVRLGLIMLDSGAVLDKDRRARKT